MKIDLYSFAFRGLLAEESLDKLGRMRYSPEALYYSEEIAKKLYLNEIDEKYVQQSKSMITVFTTITAFENATREFVYSVLTYTYKHEWWERVFKMALEKKPRHVKTQKAK